MTELGYVERPVLNWLKSLGWTFRPEKEMAKFERPIEDPLTEALLVPAVCRINSAVTSAAQAKAAIERLRQIMANPDPLEANRGALDALRDGIPIVLEPGEPATTIYFMAFENDRLNLNDFTVTNQYKVKGLETVKADTVLLVNGIPIVVAEFKSIISSGHDWKEGVNQLHRYQRETPLFLSTSIFSVAADEYEFRFGPVAFSPSSQEVINLQRDYWQPWLSQYPEKHGYWNLPADQKDNDPIRPAVKGLLRPATVLDFLQHFIVFETKKGKTTKKVARYQQFEAANDIVDRTLALYKNPAAKTQDRTGLVWHTQGSGKSLTMIYAAYKLRRHNALDGPTVLIVVDRRDLKTQIADEFTDCDYPNVSKALGVADLRNRIDADARETIVTTLQCFQRMDDLKPSLRDNTIMLIDECHRSQKGGAKGFAITMRAKLPNAFRFGFTGTPIDRTMVNTHREFGPIKDGKQERYLSYYGIRQAIRDGATLPVHFLLRQVPIEADDEPLDTGFEEMCAEMEVEDEEEKDFVQKKETRWKTLAKDTRRMKKVIAHVVDHFLTHPDPNGFKAQLVAIDRPACVKFKDLLDEELIRRGISKAEAQGMSEVIISEAQNDAPELQRFHYDKSKSDRIIAYFKLTPKQWEDQNRQNFGEERAKWTPALKILIVCDKLLTGFDAPIEQVMYLDKPLRDHNLLQAMARTNRPMPEMGKLDGLIVDYFGVFQDLQRALNFDEKDIEEAAIDWQKLKDTVPSEVARCLKYFNGIKVVDTRECLFECLQRLADETDGKRFKEDFLRLEVLWEAVSPDECLYAHSKDYGFLCSMYIAYLRRNRRQKATHEELAVKTRELIGKNTRFLEIAEDVPVYVIDADYLSKTRELPTPADRAAELEKALTKELIEGGGGFAYKKLGERLLDIIANKGDDFERAIKDLSQLVNAVNSLKADPERLGLTVPGEFGLFSVIRNYAPNESEERLAQVAKGIMDSLRKQKCFPTGWANSVAARKKLTTSLMAATWAPEWEALNLCPPEVDDPPFLNDALEQFEKDVP